MKNNLKDIVRQAIDIHFHIGPEVIPRKFTVEELIRKESGKISGLVLKNHFYPTSPFIREIKKIGDIKLFGSVVLNNAIGGLNQEVIYASNLISDLPIVVWFPTINAENFLNKSEYEIAPEWVQTKNFIARKAKDVIPVKPIKNKKVTDNTLSVLKMIKKVNGVLATGHISWQESEILVKKTQKLGIKKIVITHPIYQRIDMPIDIQKKLAKKGCFIEQSYSMYSIDKIPISKIVKHIKEIKPESIILSSDVGQPFSPSPSNALFKFSTLLKKEGITNDELITMMVKNPKKLLGID